MGDLLAEFEARPAGTEEAAATFQWGVCSPDQNLPTLKILRRLISQINNTLELISTNAVMAQNQTEGDHMRFFILDLNMLACCYRHITKVWMLIGLVYYICSLMSCFYNLIVEVFFFL